MIMNVTYAKVCAWCVQEGVQVRPSGPVSDGICRRHAVEILAEARLCFRRDQDGFVRPTAFEAAVEQKEAA
jgi:hypothetical protein